MTMLGKEVAAKKAVDSIQEGMILGLGTGSTVHYFLKELSLKQAAGLKIRAISSSEQTKERAHALGIPLIEAGETAVDLTIDGADEVDPNKNLIKGHGGALVREKILAANSKQLIIIVDESKLVSKLGSRPLPIEILPFGRQWTEHILEKWGRVERRMVGTEPFVSDNHNYIVDLHTPVIEHPAQLHQELIAIPGVVETGLFTKNSLKIIIGYNNGTVKTI